MSTPHISAKEGDFAKTVLMPGDPLRAKFIAETYLTDVRQVTAVRNMFGFTGKYNGKEISVMGSGMGCPSIGIYSWELFNFYGVETIIRVGSAGGMAPQLKLKDVLIGMAAATDSNYVKAFNLPGLPALTADFGLIEKAAAYARGHGMSYHVGTLLSSDHFYYPEGNNDTKRWAEWGVLGAEMEAAALYSNAIYAHKKALSICTVSDLVFDLSQQMTPEERQTSLKDMIVMALEIAE